MPYTSNPESRARRAPFLSLALLLTAPPGCAGNESADTGHENSSPTDGFGATTDDELDSERASGGGNGAHFGEELRDGSGGAGVGGTGGSGRLPIDETGGTGGSGGSGTPGSGGASPGCSQFRPGVSTGTSAVGPEVSGVVASRRSPGVLWLHNDSGDSATIYAMSIHGAYLATVHLQGVAAQDYEDIAIDPEHRLYVGDIGDNPSARTFIQIYRFDEPELGASDPIYVSPEVFTLTYPDGAHDAETLLVDPVTGDLYVLSKTYGTDTLYRAPAPLIPGDVTLEAVQSVNLGGDGSTSGDISPDGAWIVVRTYGNVFAWLRPPGASVAEALGGERLSWNSVDEPQGEAVAFSADGLGYFTISEGQEQPLHFFACAE